MNLYPWLTIYYNNIIHQFKKYKKNYSILLKAPKGIGIESLAKNIGLWLLCSNKNKRDIHCEKCQNCKLMYATTHPDWYNVKLISKKDMIGVDTIRWLCNQIFHTPKKNKNKIIYLPNMSKITEYGTNALLKILEEPPKNTYFIIISYYSDQLLSTLHSRCMLYKISVPSETIGIHWLKNKNPGIKKNIFKTVLRINNGAPISSNNFIIKSLWKTREKFFFELKHAIKKNDILYMLKNFSLGYVENKIFWLCTILFDAMKMKYNFKSNITNLDQKDIIDRLKKKCSFTLLDTSLRSWMQCNCKLTNISGINTELLLTDQLLRWEKILTFHIN
ncbi:hypothetical protein XW81_01630 [Buchnera aphidicola (Schlechtendalia chinensis)]|uniref:DNA polymerase III subunit delta' n=1 Tax=Buchnera aphidicola subsp. Schlechtendalia chinensis TaxID=118110 RepID=A0A172WDP3_BUCSC|nr:DNA polymerase III subunit delta' C-terminal domain-containing protein [Buchnera aphidicola]ANF17098.1 hypothetical protein XW81_01630 [Buchnera aphidicola (Schlechtendalia chinensis)]